jgi:DNA-binding NarL/FixJ family response regulator
LAVPTPSTQLRNPPRRRYRWQSFRWPRPDPARLDRLTERESEVAQAVGRGLPNAEIAATLFMSVPTVKTHVDRIFDKLEVRNRVEVAICIHDANLGEQPRKGRG